MFDCIMPGFNQIKSLQVLTVMYVGMALCSLKEMKKIRLVWISFLLKLKERENELLMNQGGAGSGLYITEFHHRQWILNIFFLSQGCRQS